MAIVLNGKECAKISAADFFQPQTRAFIVTESTPFFAECGGQCGDTGTIETPIASFRVTNTIKFGNTIIAHEGVVKSGGFASGNPAVLHIDECKRRRTCANHTVTHLLQAALRTVLGEHVTQRGSFLNDERLRFDFSHNSSISSDNLLKIENLVNEWIEQNLPVLVKTMAKEEATASGALALFGEKYEDSVRTIRILPNSSCGDAPAYAAASIDPKTSAISFELCGGTHVKNTAEIGVFRILSEASIGSGIRRIEAITGQKVLQHARQMKDIIAQILEKLKCNTEEIIKRVDDLVLELKRKNDEIIAGKHKIALHNMQKIQKSDAIILTTVLEDCNVAQLRSLSEIIGTQNPTGTIAVMIGKSEDNKVYAIVNVSKDLHEKYNAGELLKILLQPLNGKGGGGASSAQGGGTGQDKIPDALQKICNAVV